MSALSLKCPYQLEIGSLGWRSPKTGKMAGLRVHIDKACCELAKAQSAAIA